MFVSSVCCALLPLRQLINRSAECCQLCCVYSCVIYKPHRPRSDLDRSAIEEEEDCGKTKGLITFLICTLFM